MRLVHVAAPVAGDGGGAGTGPEASRSAKRTLDAPVAGTPCWRVSADERTGRSPRRLAAPSRHGRHPAADPCPPARAGVRGLAPGCRVPARRGGCVAGRPQPAARTAAMPSPMSRNSSRRSAWTRRAASRSVSAAAAASSRAKLTPGLRSASAPGSERSLA